MRYNLGSTIIYAALAVFGTSSAYAVPIDTVTIGLQTTGGISQVASNTAAASFIGTFGNFAVNISGSGVSFLGLPELLDSSANVSHRSGIAETLTVYVTDSDITSISGLVQFSSSFTQNKLPTGWSVTQDTYFDPNNTLFGGTLLDSALFSVCGGTCTTTPGAAPGDAGAGPFSVTEKFIFSTAGRGTTVSSIQLSGEVPEPASMALLGSGLIALGMVMKRRRRKAG